MASLSLSFCGLNNEHNVFDFNVSDAHFMFVIIFTIPDGVTFYWFGAKTIIWNEMLALPLQCYFSYYT